MQELLFNNPESNTLFGYNAGGNINNADGNTCIGYSAGKKLKEEDKRCNWRRFI